MQRFLWFVAGVVAGFAVAHQVNRTEGGKAFFGGLDANLRAFGRAVAEGYHDREAELKQSDDRDA